jgi:3-phosphoshikimate 1-carboxyvinyltransferase
MKQYRLRAPKKLDCTINLPASKSISNRALIIYALSGGRHLPQNLSDCDDTEVIIDALRYMPEEINIKAAGTAMRFMTAYLSVMRGTHVLTGTERMKHRPIGILVDALLKLGADIEYVGEVGYPPLRITGKSLNGGLLEIPGNVSSQYISALLMIGPMLKEGMTLRLLGDIISRPYIDLTLWTMNEFGAEAEWTSADTIVVKPKPYKSRDYFIENDWSGASYWYEMMALAMIRSRRSDC